MRPPRVTSRPRALHALLAALTVAVVTSVAPAAAAATGLRLAGTFAMQGTITVASGVAGESVGQQVRRMWTFDPGCPVGACATVTLHRRRSPTHLADTVVLRRRARGLYVGTHHFWLPALCAGLMVSHGGLAAETITVTVTQAVTTGTSELATAIDASYVNSQRVNFTACPGSLGQDAATYTGAAVTPPPAPAPPPAPPASPAPAPAPAPARSGSPDAAGGV